jgi:tetraacyldisaccharide 4'-kinase
MHPFQATLFPFSLAFASAAVLRASLYRWGILRVHSLRRPVISIGNLTVGGSGKTPMVEYIASLLLERGLPVSILSRGYRGRYDGAYQIVCQGNGPLVPPEICGDEPYLLARNLPAATVIVGGDRLLSGKTAETIQPGCIHIMDDGFQHLRLKRDLNILLLDATDPPSQTYLLPAGRLREPLSAMKRADLICITRTASDADREFVLPLIRRYHPCVPVLFSRHTVAGIVLCGDESLHPPTILHGVPLAAFAGIAKPESFFSQLQQLGYDIRFRRIFPDHYRYRPSDWADLQKQARQCGALALITTQKDRVKIFFSADQDLPLWYMKIRLTIEEERPLDQMLQRVCS